MDYLIYQNIIDVDNINTFSLPPVYTLFAFFEYLVVLSNIVFHANVTFDFGDRLIVFGTENGAHKTLKSL